MTNNTLVRIRVLVRAWIKIYMRTRNYYQQNLFWSYVPLPGTRVGIKRGTGMAERNGMGIKRGTEKRNGMGDKTQNGMAERNGDKTRNGIAERNGDKTWNGDKINDNIRHVILFDITKHAQKLHHIYLLDKSIFIMLC